MSEDFPIVRRPAPADQRPIVVSSPHSGRTIPQSERAVYALDVDELLHDGDLYVDRKGPGYYGDRGAIWAVTTHGEPIYRKPLEQAEFLRRRRSYYDPYHALLTEELERLRERFGYAILLDAHSMPSRATRLHSDPAGRPRADVVPGDLLGASCGTWLSRTTGAFWREHGYEVAPNMPYRGGGIVRRHGRPGRRVHAIQLELNRALYMDEDSLERLPELSKLRDDCVAFVARLAETEPDDA